MNIARVDRNNGTVSGGDEMFILCDKVQKGKGKVWPLKLKNKSVLFCCWDQTKSFQQTSDLDQHDSSRM